MTPVKEKQWNIEKNRFTVGDADVFLLVRRVEILAMFIWGLLYGSEYKDPWSIIIPDTQCMTTCYLQNSVGLGVHVSVNIQGGPLPVISRVTTPLIGYRGYFTPVTHLWARKLAWTFDCFDSFLLIFFKPCILTNLICCFGLVGQPPCSVATLCSSSMDRETWDRSISPGELVCSCSSCRGDSAGILKDFSWEPKVPPPRPRGNPKK